MNDQTQENSKEPITRQALYDLVWTEPMLKVAAQFGVSSSYMARVCTALNVPRPERGYWARLAVGKAPLKPPLPDARPGDQLEWLRGGEIAHRPLRRARPRLEAAGRVKPDRRLDPAIERHRLVIGARELFEAGRESWTVGYLKPAKRLLVDFVVARPTLGKALDFANRLFLALESEGYPVGFAVHGEYFQRAQVDIREVSTKAPPPQENLWCPARCTVATVKGVQLGLTIIEMAEHVEVRYVNGKYLRLRDVIAPKRARYQVDPGWISQRDMPSGRLCLQAYSPYPGTQWQRVWRETPERDLTVRIPSIIQELVRAVPEVLRQVDEAEQAAEARRLEWEEQKARWDREREEERVAKAIKDSTDQLLGIIRDWSAARRLEEFFETARREIEVLPPWSRGPLLERLERARELMAGPNPLERLRTWRTPEER